MRKALAVLLSFGFLVACTRPAQAPETDVLATSVAATLTAQVPAVQPTLTPSVTALPTTTLIPTELPEATETAAATSTASATVSALPTDDPRFGLDLSSPDSVDDFSQPFTFFPIDDEDATIVWEDGRLRATDHVADPFLWWSTTGIPASDVYVEVTVAVGECAGKDAYGLAARVGGANFDQGYTLELACDGTYRVRKFIGVEEPPAVLRNWTVSENIQSGPNVTNVIGLVADGADLYPVVNGEPLVEAPIQDSDYESGFFSLFPSADQTDGFTVYFDDFKLWTLSP